MSVQRCSMHLLGSSWALEINLIFVQFFTLVMSLSLPQNRGSKCHYHHFVDEETDAQRSCTQSETAEAGLILLPAGWKTQGFLAPPQPIWGCWVLEWEGQDGRKLGGKMAKWGTLSGQNGIERSCSVWPISISSRLSIISYFVGNISQVRNLGLQKQCQLLFEDQTFWWLRSYVQVAEMCKTPLLTNLCRYKWSDPAGRTRADLACPRWGYKPLPE